MRIYSQLCQQKYVAEAKSSRWFDLSGRYINNDLIDNENLRAK
ncbi:hypothetical protein CSC17_5589 [Klebsiella oxytoca]|nr:hypothetical protein CSC17_5589 [Klebsiella oxytoca]